MTRRDVQGDAFHGSMLPTAAEEGILLDGSEITLGLNTGKMTIKPPSKGYRPTKKALAALVKGGRTFHKGAKRFKKPIPFAPKVQATPAELPKALYRGVSEKDFQRDVVTAAKMLGWVVYHTFDSQRSEPGFPDLILSRGERMLAWELKRESGMPTAAQREWLMAFSRVGVRAEILWPSDMDKILEALK